MLSNKTPKLDRSDGVKEMKEKAPKRKLPFTTGANGDQKDSDSGKRILKCTSAYVLISKSQCDLKWKVGVTMTSHPLKLIGST